MYINDGVYNFIFILRLTKKGITIQLNEVNNNNAIDNDSNFFILKHLHLFVYIVDDGFLRKLHCN